LLRRAQQQWWSVTSTSQRKRNLSPHALYLGSAKLIERADLARREEGLSGGDVAGCELRQRGGERA
jgi:hypothetical protein